jgi:hypothetical protein
MKPICVPCRRFFQPKKTGLYFLEGRPRHAHVEPGTAEMENWLPYKLWNGDLYQCQGCGSLTIVGVARLPIGEHYEPDFEDKLREFQPSMQVNDC